MTLNQLCRGVSSLKLDQEAIRTIQNAFPLTPLWIDLDSACNYDTLNTFNIFWPVSHNRYGMTAKGTNEKYPYVLSSVPVFSKSIFNFFYGYK